MKEGWINRKLGDICEFISGFTPKKEELNSVGGIPYYKVSDMNRATNVLYMSETELYVNKSKKIIPANSIVFPKNGGAIFTGKKRILSYDSIVDLNTEAISIKRDDILLRYLYLCLQGINFGQFDNGGGLPSLNIKKMKEFTIPVPSLPEQQRIVELLDAEFAKIDSIKANAEQQLQAAKDLFQAALKELLTPKEGWKYKPLGEITASINGLWKGKKPPYVNVGVIRNANFTKDFTLNTSNIEYLDVEERQYKSRKLEKGDLIVEKSGGSEKQPVGRTVLFDLDGEFSVSNFTSILRIKDKSAILPAFLYLYLLFVYKEGVTKTMQNAATGIHNIIYDLFLAIPIPILPIGEQQRIVKLLEAVIEKIYSLRSNYDNTITLCNDLKQSLLKSIFA